VCVANILIDNSVGFHGGGDRVEYGTRCTVVSFGHSTNEVDSLKAAYADAEWLDDQYAELSAVETVVGAWSRLDCGRWARLVGRKTKGSVGSRI
jgi:hypothetical protein